MSKEVFVVIMKTLDGIYKMQLTEYTIAIWYGIFKDYDENIFRKAVTMYIENEKFSPVPAGIIEYIPKIRTDLLWLDQDIEQDLATPEEQQAFQEKLDSIYIPIKM